MTAGARFCHACGATQGGSRRSGMPVLPWALAGGAVVLLILAIAVAPEPRSAPQTEPAAAGSPAAPDLSSMTPRQQADRLFDRVMTAAEGGDTAEVARFASKTIQAYGILGGLDEDARFHVALIETLLGNVAAALAQADSMDAAAPGHLLASVIRYRAADAAGDPSGRLQAYRQFLENYEREIALNRPEYAAHQITVDSFRDEARRATGSEGGS